MIEVLNNSSEILSILKGMLLLILSLSGNYLAETLGCQNQHLLDSMFVKHI